MKSVMAALIASSVLVPMLSYGFPMLLTDSQGKPHQANAEFMITENGAPLPDGTYTTPKGKSITIKDGKMSISQDLMGGMKTPPVGGMGTMPDSTAPAMPAAAPSAPAPTESVPAAAPAPAMDNGASS